MARTIPLPEIDPPIDGDQLSVPWREWLAAIASRPSCHLYRSAVQSVATGAFADVLWTQEDHDNAEMHDLNANTDRLVIPEDGLYCFGGHAVFDADAVGFRRLAISLNDPAPLAAANILIQDIQDPTTDLNNQGRLDAMVTRQLVYGDILRMAVRQDSGGALDLLGETATGPQANGFWCFKVGY